MTAAADRRFKRRSQESRPAGIVGGAQASRSGMLSNDRLAFACGTGSRPHRSSKPVESIPNIAAKIHAKMRRRLPRRPDAKILHGCYCYSCRFCYWSFRRPLFGPATTCAPAAVPPSAQVECKKVQYQCEFLHLVISSPLALFQGQDHRLQDVDQLGDGGHGDPLACSWKMLSERRQIGARRQERAAAPKRRCKTYLNLWLDGGALQTQFPLVHCP